MAAELSDLTEQWLPFGCFESFRDSLVRLLEGASLLEEEEFYTSVVFA